MPGVSKPRASARPPPPPASAAGDIASSHEVLRVTNEAFEGPMRDEDLAEVARAATRYAPPPHRRFLVSGPASTSPRTSQKHGGRRVAAAGGAGKSRPAGLTSAHGSGGAGGTDAALLSGTGPMPQPPPYAVDDPAGSPSASPLHGPRSLSRTFAPGGSDKAVDGGDGGDGDGLRPRKSAGETVAGPEPEEGCPFVGCGGCKDPLTCGYRTQFDSSLVVAHLRASGRGLLRPDLLTGERGAHAAAVAAAQRWERESQAEGGGDGVVVHQVTSSDTLQGIAIRYGTTTAAIRRANKMPSNDVISFRSLKVPSPSQRGQAWSPSPGPRALALIVRSAMVKRLTELADASFEEARVLLDLNDWDMEAAVAEQTEWEEQEAKLRGGKMAVKSGVTPSSALPLQPTSIQQFLYLQASR